MALALRSSHGLGHNQLGAACPIGVHDLAVPVPPLAAPATVTPPAAP